MHPVREPSSELLRHQNAEATAQRLVERLHKRQVVLRLWTFCLDSVAA
jgi:hypothetical protein